MDNRILDNDTLPEACEKMRRMLDMFEVLPAVAWCEHCEEYHEPSKCCECGAQATAQGKFPYLCPDHGYEAYEDERANR